MKINMTMFFDNAGFSDGYNPQKIIEDFLMRARAIMRMQIDKGVDVDGKPFVPYSESYKEYKKAVGRQPGSEGDWLRLTGQLMGSMAITKLDLRSGILGFIGGRTKEAPKMPGRTKEAPKMPDSEKKRKSKSGPKMQSNAMVAYAVNLVRSFVGLSKRNADIATEETIAYAIEQGWL